MWVTKGWIKRIYIYPQKTIVPGAHFDYDSYWKEKRGGKFMGGLGTWQEKRAILASKLIENLGGGSINDIGSGAGEVLVRIQKLAHITSAVAYDNSEYALQIASELGLKTKKLDITKPEQYGEIAQADFTILFEILEHIPGPEELLKSSYEKSSKSVMFSFPNTGFIIPRLRLVFGRFPLQWAKHPGEHLRFWTQKDLVWWLKAQGYKQYTIHYYVGVPYLRQLWPNMFAAGFFVEIRKQNASRI